MQKHTKMNSPLLSQAYEDVVWHWFVTFHDSGKQALHFFVDPFFKQSQLICDGISLPEF